MKNSMKILAGKAGRMFMVTMISLPVFVTSCDKDDEDTGNTVAEDEAAEVVMMAVDPTTGGLVAQTDYAVAITLTNSNPANCGVSQQENLSKQGGTTNRSYSYSYSWSRLLTCSGTTPVSFQHNFNGTNSYTAPRMSSDDHSEGDFSVTGLDPAGTELIFNHTYSRTGTQQSKVRNERALESKVSIQTTAVKVNKTNKVITSGTGTFTVSGTASTGKSFNYSGTLTFNGGNKATLALTGGATYSIQW